MTDACRETLHVLGVTGAVPVVGHSQATLCALHLALTHPGQVERLLLIGAVAGGARVTRADRGLPFSLSLRDRRFWQIAWNGSRLARSGDLRAHRRLLAVVQELSFADPALAPVVTTGPEDRKRPAPVRDRWQARIRHADLRSRLAAVTMPAMVCAGRHDPQTPLAANGALANGLPSGQLVIFEHSGRYPFIEEPRRFADMAAPFLAGRPA
jgi:pimeloyl-ACP methyl ester carboxylesterase